MPDISKVQLPSGGVYDIKDAVARQMISGGVSFIIAWDGNSTPDVTKIPQGIRVVYYNTEYVGTLAASSAQTGAFYLVASSTTQGTGSKDYYDEYVPVDENGTKKWEKIGDTLVDMNEIVKGVAVGGQVKYPDVNQGNIVEISWSDMELMFDEYAAPTIYVISVSGNNAALYRSNTDLSTMVPAEYNQFRFDLLTLAHQPIYIIQAVATNDIRYYSVESIDNTASMVTLQAIDGNTKYVVTLQDDSDPKLVGTITSSPILSSATLNKQTDVVLGENTTFALANGAVTHGSLNGHTDTVLGTGTTFTVTDPVVTVTPSQTYLGASASGAAVGANGTASAVTGYASPTTQTFLQTITLDSSTYKLVQTTVPNVTSIGAASTWSFTMGTGDNSETLIIGGANGTAPTFGNAITVATGTTDTDGTGAGIVTGYDATGAKAITALGTPTTETVLTGVKMTSQPTITLSANATSGTGRVQVATGITSAVAEGGAVSASGDNVTAIVSMPTSTVGTSISVGTNDKVTALTSATSLTTQ